MQPLNILTLDRKTTTLDGTHIDTLAAGLRASLLPASPMIA